MMVNLMFGAYCPELQKMLTDEIHKVQKNEDHEFCISVSERSPEEQKRLKILEEERVAKEAAKKAQKGRSLEFVYFLTFFLFMYVSHSRKIFHNNILLLAFDLTRRFEC